MATPLLVLIILAIVIIASIITSVVTLFYPGEIKESAWQSNTASLVLQNNI